jgi:hypothetical protein
LNFATSCMVKKRNHSKSFCNPTKISP